MASIPHSYPMDDNDTSSIGVMVLSVIAIIAMLAVAVIAIQTMGTQDQPDSDVTPEVSLQMSPMGGAMK